MDHSELVLRMTASTGNEFEVMSVHSDRSLYMLGDFFSSIRSLKKIPGRTIPGILNFQKQEFMNNYSKKISITGISTFGLFTGSRRLRSFS